MYSLKIKIFKIFQKIFKFFNLKIYYSKDENIFNDLKPESIIDVGVEKGTKFLFKNFPNAHFYLIEANSNYYDYLENKFLKKYSGKLFRVAAGEKNEEKFFYHSGPISSFYERENFKFKHKKLIKIKKLDEILIDENIPKKTILKIDCEGGELDVLKGAEKTLSIVDYVIIELRLQKINTYNPSELIHFLYKKNFFWEKVIKVYFAKIGIDYIDILFIKKKI